MAPPVREAREKETESRARDAGWLTPPEPLGPFVLGPALFPLFKKTFQLLWWNLQESWITEAATASEVFIFV